MHSDIMLRATGTSCANRYDSPFPVGLDAPQRAFLPPAVRKSSIQGESLLEFLGGPESGQCNSAIAGVPPDEDIAGSGIKR